MMALSSALVGTRKRRAVTDIHTASMTHAGTIAAARFVASPVPPAEGPAIANNIAKMSSSCAFGVRAKRAMAVTGWRSSGCRRGR